jgi:hypothetical protein
MAKERNERLPSLDALIHELERFATAEAFRAQMTADYAPLPRVVSASDRPLSQPPLLLSERADTAVDTPMSASVPPGEIPRRNEARVWLVGGAVVASLLGALMFVSGKRAASPSAQAPSSAVGPVVPSASAATLQPSAAAPGAQVAALPASGAEIPTGKAPPSAQAEPTAQKRAESVAKPKAKSAPPHVEARAAGRAPAHPPHPAIASRPPPVPAEPPQPAPAAAKAPAANGGTAPKLRAGKLNSVDF